MRFTPTSLSPAVIIEIDKIEDQRGFFARIWDKKILEENNLNSSLVQCNISYNKKTGTLRGLHFQKPPFEEAKIVRCTKGRIFDVIVDLRSDSSTILKWFGVELSSENRKMLYVPEGFAHGYLTLDDDVEVFYQVTEYYTPNTEGGLRWDDPKLKINWPITPIELSEKDSKWPYIE
jgi:dTDP-4-dehydrorhamnose 3,5-epimerase